MLYYAGHLKVTHRKDLANKELEAIWIQVKLPTYNTLFSVINRSELESPNFFAHLQDTLEKAWLKTDNIFLLGDFNCNLLDLNEDSPTGLPDKTRKLLNVLDSFCMRMLSRSRAAVHLLQRL